GPAPQEPVLRARRLSPDVHEPVTQIACWWQGHDHARIRQRTLQRRRFYRRQCTGRAMKVHGHCHCGQVTYEAEVDPALAAICHCTDCQQLSGSPYRVTLPTPVQNFRLTRGTLKTYVKTAESGTKRAQTFCPECGSPIYAAAPVDPPTISLRWGSIV